MLTKHLSKIPDKVEYEKYVLKNGLEVVLIPVKNVFSVDAKLTVRVGSQYENKELNGISHFLEHMNFKGTIKKPSHSLLVKDIDDNGGQQNASTGYDFTSYYAHIGFEYLESILDFLSDTFVNSVFPEEEFQKEKGVIIEEIRMYEDQPRAQAEDLLMEVLYGDQPAGWNIAGTEKNILNMTRSQMVEFYKKYYHPKNAVLFVMGNFDKIKTKKLIKKYFGFEVKTKAISFPKAKMVFDGPKVNLKTKDVKETHFVLGFNAFKLYDKRNAVVSVINGILSSGFNSRLYLNVREKLGGAYYVHSGVDKLYDRGIFEVSAGVNTGKTEMILKEIIKELQKLKTEAVEEKELDKVKNRIIGSILMWLDRPYTITDPVEDAILYKNKVESFRKYIDDIMKVTSKDVLKISNEIFKSDNIKMGVVTSAKNAKELKDIIKTI
jgi:predicted Zn-dependent peptidase